MKIAMSKEIPDVPQDLDSNLRDFILQCLQRDPMARPHAKDLLKHKFLSEDK